MLEKALQTAGVNVLRNQETSIEKTGERIRIIGLDDPNFSTISAAEFIDEQLNDGGRYEFTILLAHRPELFSVYVKHGVDLVLSGHAHGGQFRIGKQGIFAPGQGLFPKYTHGVVTEGRTSMVISRGIGNSAFPFRVNNRPELVMVTLAK
jgi:predicted MPP superfamily phosphohydrolase